MAPGITDGGLATRTAASRVVASEKVKKSLEQQYLTPPTTFSAEWLNRLQRRWDNQIDYTDLCQIAPTQSRTVTRFIREGLEGRVTGYKEVTVPASGATAKDSTSMLRRPADRADFVRGAAGYFPFAPGGLDGVDAIQAYEDQTQLELEEGATKKANGLSRVINFGAGDGLLQIPPGFTRGLDFDKQEKEGDEAVKVLEEADSISSSGTNGTLNGRKDSSDSATPSGEDTDDDDVNLDELLPVEFPSLAPHGQLKASTARDKGREWAHVVDVNKAIPNFTDLVPSMARTWPFELDTFQKEAVYHLESGDSVFVAAHTSAGKTVVAEYAIALSAKHMTKTIYTSPIKALSNQKFRDFKQEFDDVGILTGDVQINPEASCLIMTTEILRSMLYRGADLIRDVEFVIFDEVHYLNDQERGVVWEEVIIMLPDHINLILLSATIPNTKEFAQWVGRTKKKNIFVISTSKRPVPLEHYLWAGKEMHKIVTSDRAFVDKGWKAANDILSGLDKVKEQKAIEATSASNRGNTPSRGGRAGQQQRGNNQRGGPQQRGRGGPPTNRGQGNIARTGRGSGRTTAAQDRTVWVGLVDYLKNNNLLPACIFVFSKKRCEENADSLGKKDFCTAAEKSAIHMTIERSIARLKPEDRLLPQIGRLRDMLERGIAVHHGGLLPIVKEIVEILFAQTLVKVLFATETFAMGLNLPTRTVVFSGYRKHDGREFRNLLPGEYTQMAGRAGRRGLDTVGTVIIVAAGRTDAPPAAELRSMILGQPTKLRSQFRLHYNMILNLMRVEALKIEEMIKRSFSENATQALLPQHEKQISLSQANLDKIKRDPCPICDIDLQACHDAAIEYEELTKELHQKLLASPVGRRLWTTRRLIVFKKNNIRTVGIIQEDNIKGGPNPSLKVFAIINIDATRTETDLLPFLPAFRQKFPPLPKDPFKLLPQTVLVPLEDIEAVTATLVKVDVRTILNDRAEQKIFIENEFIKSYTDWASKVYDEQEWNKVTELSVREVLSAREKFAKITQESKCLSCPDFLKHYAQEHDEHLIRTTITSLQRLMSDQNLSLLPDYHQRVSVLHDLGFIDAQRRVQLKGKVACEVHSADELVLTELILENVLAQYSPQEIVALLSCFVFQEKTDVEPQLTESLKKGVEAIVAISERVNHYQILHQVILGSDDANDFVSRPRFGLVEVVYNWADGMSFKEITDLTDVMEGTIVRVVTRLDETCREVMSAARLVGDPGLYQKMEKAREMIRRDVVFTASLYM
ncbi:putative ATP-dependent RNA helicase [Cyphellophora attinorum]|uniref:Putative ATP-dependent RNA helicase n=1 Tax=Cyphellophora attinorum TaxID=1664694 RepID=A0A0N1H2T9_9EURO|nr:putative ATP-dependent RNA helicase [Phialophora attinorum]KPI34847.1 putative ATP-dependent RNA helicase [Phialophora attinorum]